MACIISELHYGFCELKASCVMRESRQKVNKMGKIKNMELAEQ